MDHIFHPTFDTLYIDPEEGVYWDGTVAINDAQVPAALMIDDPAHVTKPALEKAAGYIKHIRKLLKKAYEAFPAFYVHNPAGSCWHYFKENLEALSDEDFAVLFPACTRAAITPQEFMARLQPTLIARYPAEEDTPLIIDFSLGEAYTNHILSVAFDPDDNVVDITHEEE